MGGATACSMNERNRSGARASSPSAPEGVGRDRLAFELHLHDASGFTTVAKSGDMLVFQRNLAKPMVYSRCD